MGFIPKDARWYLADIVLEHKIEGEQRNVVHVNTHLIEARSPEEAYKKAVALGRSAKQKYRNTDGKQVRVSYRGLQDLNVIHEPLEDGAELSFVESVGVSEQRLKKRITPKARLGVFEATRKSNGPNYMPESVMQMLEAEGISRDEVLG